VLVSLCCKSIERLVKDYKDMLRGPLGVSSVVPSPARPSRKHLVDAISYACWEQKAQNMDFPLNLDLHLPLPEHMGEFNSNILAILSDFDQLEVEQALRAAGGSNPPSPR
jgi:hypothetical protein